MEEDSTDLYFAIDGEVSVYRDSTDAGYVEKITTLSDKRQVYDIFVDYEGMYIGVSDSTNTNFEAHDYDTIKNANPKTYYIDRINNTVTEDKDNAKDGYIRNVLWVNDITKYVIYDSKHLLNQILMKVQNIGLKEQN